MTRTLLTGLVAAALVGALSEVLRQASGRGQMVCPMCLPPRQEYAVPGRWPDGASVVLQEVRFLEDIRW